MDWRNRENVYASVDDLRLDENRLLAKSRSDASILNLEGCRVYNEEIEVDLRDSSLNFDAAFDRLTLGARDSNTNQGTQTCQCVNCAESEEASKETKTRDFHRPEILNYQGHQYSPEDIAVYWKKDSRMWLWKSVRLARKRMREADKTLPNSSPQKTEHKESNL